MSWIKIEDRGPIRWLTMDNPGRRNAVPSDGWNEIKSAIESFEDSDSRVLVITGADGDFCAGADLDPAGASSVQSVTGRHRRMKEVGAAATTLHRVSKPTIAAVDGVAVGAGLNLALGCDMVIATDRSRFSEIFVRRGLTIDFGGTWLLPRVVGLQRAKEMALTGRILDADEALEIGLVLDVVTTDELQERVDRLCEELLKGAPIAQSLAKQALDASHEMSFGEAISWEGQSQTVAFGTEDVGEGLAAFVEKRSPDWKGK